jgi:hypothetical protein
LIPKDYQTLSAMHESDTNDVTISDAVVTNVANVATEDVGKTSAEKIDSLSAELAHLSVRLEEARLVPIL